MKDSLKFCFLVVSFEKLVQFLLCFTRMKDISVVGCNKLRCVASVLGLKIVGNCVSICNSATSQNLFICGWTAYTLFYDAVYLFAYF